MKKNICINFLVIVLILIIIVTIIIALKNIIYDINYVNKINSIMADTVEIEKKWLIDKDKIPYDLSNSEIIELYSFNMLLEFSISCIF